MLFKQGKVIRCDNFDVEDDEDKVTGNVLVSGIWKILYFTNYTTKKKQNFHYSMQVTHAINKKQVCSLLIDANWLRD